MATKYAQKNEEDSIPARSRAVSWAGTLSLMARFGALTAHAPQAGHLDLDPVNADQRHDRVQRGPAEEHRRIAALGGAEVEHRVLVELERDRRAATARSRRSRREQRVRGPRGAQPEDRPRPARNSARSRRPAPSTGGPSRSSRCGWIKRAQVEVREQERREEEGDRAAQQPAADPDGSGLPLARLGLDVAARGAEAPMAWLHLRSLARRRPPPDGLDAVGIGVIVEHRGAVEVVQGDRRWELPFGRLRMPGVRPRRARA